MKTDATIAMNDAWRRACDKFPRLSRDAGFQFAFHLGFAEGAVYVLDAEANVIVEINNRHGGAGVR